MCFSKQVVSDDQAPAHDSGWCDSTQPTHPMSQRRRRQSAIAFSGKFQAAQTAEVLVLVHCYWCCCCCKQLVTFAPVVLFAAVAIPWQRLDAASIPWVARSCGGAGLYTAASTAAVVRVGDLVWQRAGVARLIFLDRQSAPFQLFRNPSRCAESAAT